MFNTKNYSIELLKTAEINLLNSFKGIHPNEVHQQAHPDFNSISWIFGHCTTHFHMVLCQTCQETEIFSDDVANYYRYGTTKEEIKQVTPPIAFSELVDEYSRVSSSSFRYLESLDDDDFREVIFPEIKENLMTSMLRIAFHYMGHMGQIVLIRRALGNPGPTFVGGIYKAERERIKQEWDSWWNESKKDFGV